MAKRILFVDDNWEIDNWKKRFEDAWKNEDKDVYLDFEVFFEARSKNVLRRVKTDGPFHLLLLDLMFEDQKLQGEGILRLIKKNYPELPVIILSGREEDVLPRAVSCIKMGAENYIEKKHINFQKLALEIRTCIQLAEERQNVQGLKEELKGYQKYDDLKYQSNQMASLIEELRKVADTPTTVLIIGESGTGKELIARALHQMSPRRNKPFISFNCSAITETLAESELFGHRKGSFTSAIDSRTGLFESANGGTLFLDEIAELVPELQAKLLRTLPEKTIRRVGESHEIHVNFRIIAATNKNLAEQVRLEKFRNDLFYRLNIFTVYVPPLRDRKEDIPILVKHFLEKFNEKLGQNIREITLESLQQLENHDWIGNNVRELENAIEYAFIQARPANLDKILPEHLPPSVKGLRVSSNKSAEVLLQKQEYVDSLCNGELSFKEITDKFKDMEKQIVLSVLERERGNGASAAKILGVSRGTLAKWLHRWNISTMSIRSSK